MVQPPPSESTDGNITTMSVSSLSVSAHFLIPHSLILEDLQLELEGLRRTGAALMAWVWKDIPHTCICLARGELDLDLSPINQ